MREEIIVTKFCSKNLGGGEEIPIYGHQMVCLNPNYPELDTPVAIRDWLDLFYQSIHSPERPSINRNNAGVKRAADLIDYNNLTPEQRKSAKEKEQGEVVRSIYMQEGEQREKKEVAKKAILKGFDNEIICDITGLSESEIENLRKEE